MNETFRPEELDARLAAAEAEIQPMMHALAAQGPAREEFVDDLQRRLALEIVEPPSRGWWASLAGRGRRGPVRAAIAASLAVVLFATGGLLYPRFTPAVDARALLEQAQQVPGVTGVGQVRHVVTTYTMSPSFQPGRSQTLDQWFGNVDGRLVARQTGMMGELTVLDTNGTGWIWVAENQEALKLPSGGKGIPLRTPNQVALDGVGAAQSQARVTGHTTVNGRAATIVELTRTLPAMGFRDMQIQQANPGAAPQVFAFAENDSGAMVVISPQGGTMVSEVVVDDQTHQVVRGHTVSKDPTGAIAGTTDWQVTVDQTTAASQAPAGLFTFTVPAGATVREIPPGAPVDIRIEKRL